MSLTAVHPGPSRQCQEPRRGPCTATKSPMPVANTTSRQVQQGPRRLLQRRSWRHGQRRATCAPLQRLRRRRKTGMPKPGPLRRDEAPFGTTPDPSHALRRRPRGPNTARSNEPSRSAWTARAPVCPPCSGQRTRPRAGNVRPYSPNRAHTSRAPPLRSRSPQFQRSRLVSVVDWTGVSKVDFQYDTRVHPEALNSPVLGDDLVLDGGTDLCWAIQGGERQDHIATLVGLVGPTQQVRDVPDQVCVRRRHRRCGPPI